MKLFFFPFQADLINSKFKLYTCQILKQNYLMQGENRLPVNTETVNKVISSYLCAVIQKGHRGISGVNIDRL